MLRLVEYEKETVAAAVKSNAPPNVSPRTPTPSFVAYFLTFENDATGGFLKPDVTLVSEKGDKHHVSL